jgi:NTP pyrophosphatase (non-canonical NTP hydrolase)
MKSIKEWQREITDWAESKGFNWNREDVDTMLLRLHSEVSEAGEAARDDDFEGFKEELADIAIRLFNTAEVFGIDLEKEIEKKMSKNKKRPVLHGRRRK